MKTPCEPKTLTQALQDKPKTGEALLIAEQFQSNPDAERLAMQVSDALAKNRGEPLRPAWHQLPILP
jgi:hypothetical protein